MSADDDITRYPGRRQARRHMLLDDFMASLSTQTTSGHGEGSTMFTRLPETSRSQTNNIEAEQQKPKQPITTLVSALPQTTYRDEDDKSPSAKALPYLRVQNVILKWLEKRASDTLTALQARKWTQVIEPTTGVPSAEDALRLCYYMRSQGFDTYATTRKSTMSLFVVAQGSHERGEFKNHLYWRQNFMTDVIDFIAPATDNVGGRRNAIVANPFPPVDQTAVASSLDHLLVQPQPQPRTAETTGTVTTVDRGVPEPGPMFPQSLFVDSPPGNIYAQLYPQATSGQGQPARIPNPNDDDDDDDDDDDQVSPGEFALAAALDLAQNNLDFLLNDPIPPNPLSIQTLVSTIEDLTTRLNTIITELRGDGHGHGHGPQ